MSPKSKISQEEKKTSLEISDLEEKITDLEAKVKKEKERYSEGCKNFADKFAEYDAIFSSFPDLIFIISREGVIIENIGGPKNELFMDSSEFKNKNIREVLPENICNAFFNIMKKINNNSKEILNYEYIENGKTNHYQAIINQLDKEKVLFVSRNINDVIKNENILKKKDKLLSAISKASGYLLKVKDLDKSINYALKEVGEAVSVDRLYIFENFKNKKGKLLTSQIYEWTSNKADSQLGNPDLSDVDYDYIPYWKSTMLYGSSINSLVKDLPKEEREILEPQNIKSILVIPIFLDSFFWGFMGFDNITDERYWEQTEIDMLTSLANIFAINIEEKRTHAKYIDKVKELSVVHQIVHSANNADNLSELFENIIASSLELFNFDGGGIYIVNEKTKKAELVYHRGINEEFINKNKDIDINKYPYNKVFIDKEPIFAENYQDINRENSKKYNLASVASIPIINENKAIGAINLKSSIYRTIPENIKELLVTISKEIAGTFHRISLSERIIQNELNLTALFNTIDDMLFVLDNNGNILKINDSVLTKLKYKESEIINKNVINLHTPEGRESASKVVKDMLDEKEEYCFIPLITKNDIKIDVETKVKLGNWNNKPVIFGISRDITKRKQLEEILKESEKKYRLLAENSEDIICLINLNGVFEFVSPSIKTVMGYETSELIGKSPIEYMTEEDSNRYKDLILPEILINDSKYVYEASFKKKDNSIVVLETVLTPVKDENGKTHKILSASRDISIRKIGEENIKKAYEKEKELNEMKTNFISTTSHEFKTPLTAILSSAELLELYGNKWDLEKKKHHFAKIISSVKKINSMLNNILSFNRIENSQSVLKRVQFNLKNMCDELINDFNERIMYKYKLEYNYKLPKDIYFLDAEHLTRALDNLLRNAAKFSNEQSKIIFNVTEKNKNLIFEVIDEGIGIPEDEVDKIFDKFYRGSNASQVPGTGIGLSLVQMIASMYGGKVKCTRNRIKGTTFKLIIPLK